jgi:hypothetical protein
LKISLDLPFEFATEHLAAGDVLPCTAEEEKKQAACKCYWSVKESTSILLFLYIVSPFIYWPVNHQQPKSEYKMEWKTVPAFPSHTLRPASLSDRKEKRTPSCHLTKLVLLGRTVVPTMPCTATASIIKNKISKLDARADRHEKTTTKSRV